MSVADLADWNVAATQLSPAMANVDLPDWTEGVIVSNLPAGGGGPSAAVSGLTGHWDASAITGLADGAKVGMWLDVSGGGYHVIQSTPARQPVYYSTTVGQTLNGLPVVTFVEDTAHNTGQVLATSVSVPLSSPTTIQVAARFDDVSVFPHNWFLAGVYIAIETDNGQWVAGNGVDSLMAAGATTGPHVVTVYFVAPGTSVIRVDGTQVLSSTTANRVYSAGTAYVGADSGPGNWFWGAIGELLYYSGVTLTTAQLAANEQYLKAKWGTP